MKQKLMYKIFSQKNMNKAFLKVKRNKGTAGVDGMNIEDTFEYLKQYGDELRESLIMGTYVPKPVLRVEIPKDNGKIRKLGIPTVIDRIIGQAIMNILTPIIDPTFSNNSYGFRPRRSSHDAIKKSKEIIDSGYEYVVDIDLSQYFDTINQDRLMYLLTKHIEDKDLLRLINKFLYCGVSINGKVYKSRLGVPQGGALSPLLSNVYLHELDTLLESRNIKFVRYADDVQIFVMSKRAGLRVMRNTTKYLNEKLDLKVNQEKSKVVHYTKSTFLGFGFHKYNGKCSITISNKSRLKFKTRIKTITKRNRGKSIEVIIFELNQFTTGWINYYKVANNNGFIRNSDSWIKRKVRVYIWKQWKKTKTKYKNLVSLGIDEPKAWEYANTRKGLWRISKSPILSRTLTNKYIGDLGYKSLTKMYSN
jgi:RNA-directed DNA polymerase